MLFKRRGFLKGVAAAGGCMACARLAAASGDVPWSYSGNRGPGNWGYITGDYATCAVGAQQSPIDITGAISAGIDPLKLDWKTSSADVVNNGHTIQIDIPPGSTLEHGGETYELLQFHFHAPGEHTIDGKVFPMEIHFVHRNAQTRMLAVLGLMVETGGDNGPFSQLTSIFPSKAGEKLALKTANASMLLPKDRAYYTYEGSLTTPPCSEIVTWLVLKTPLVVAERDVKRFTRIYKSNARPIAPTNRRLILQSR